MGRRPCGFSNQSQRRICTKTGTSVCFEKSEPKFKLESPGIHPINNVQTVSFKKQRLPCLFRPYQQTNTVREHLAAFRAWRSATVADGRLRTAVTLRRAVWRNR